MNRPVLMNVPARPVAQQNQQVFDIYNIYRLVLSLILLSSFFFGSPTTILGSLSPDLFLKVCIGYIAFNLLTLFRGLLPGGTARWPSLHVAIQLADILFLALLSHTCGGVRSGIAHLLIVPVAAGSLLSPARMSIFLAAVGSIAIMYSELYLYFTLNQDDEYYVQAGLLGLTLFITALAIQLLGGRLRQNEQVAERQAQRIQSLLEMNYKIIQRMRTGIVVVDEAGGILHANSSARKLLRLPEDEEVQGKLPAVLEEQLARWIDHPGSHGAPFRVASSEREVQANFSYLAPGDPTLLIFLEDYSLLTSRVQQLKLVSLGRLTASIAHEVRNPLGAISHSSQLLRESDSISNEDRRFVDIILNHSKRVNAIIENILQLSRNKGEVPQFIDLGGWLEQFVIKFSNSYSHPVDIRLRIESPGIQVRVNPSQLEQLMTNLCDNGLRYSMKATGEFRLMIRCGVGEGKQSPWLDVIDEGEGIAAGDGEKIFEPFYTTENTGTGLGLYICREICEANQAQLFYRRTREGKSRFRVLFAHPDRNII